MNTSAIIVLVIMLTTFIGGIGFCISRVGSKQVENDFSEE